MTREQLVKLARAAAAGINRPVYCHNPASFDPHEWVLDAMKAAYLFGREEAIVEDREKSRGIVAAGIGGNASGGGADTTVTIVGSTGSVSGPTRV